MGSGLFSALPDKTSAGALVIAALLCLFAPTYASAAGDTVMPAGDDPVVVTAKTLVADNKKKLVTYRGTVVVKQGKMTLYADEVEVKLAGKDGGADRGEGPEAVLAGSGSIKTIRAFGNVRMVIEDKSATSDEALYNADTKEIVMTGSPRLWQGPNVLTGSKITFSIPDDTISVEDAKTVLYPDESPEGAVRP